MKSLHSNLNLLLLLIALYFFSFGVIELPAQESLRPVIQFGHPGFVVSDLALSPDGKILASSDGQYLKLWDLDSGLEFRSFKEPSGLKNIEFSTNGNFISYSTMFSSVTRSVNSPKIGSITSLENEDSFFKPESEGTNVEDIELYLDRVYSIDRSLEAVLTNRELNVYKLPERKKIKTIKNEFSFFESLTGKKLLAISSDNQTVLFDTILYEINSKEERFKIESTQLGIYPSDIVFAGDRNSIILCGSIIPSKADHEQSSVTALDNTYFMRMLLRLYPGHGKTIVEIDASSGKVKRTIETTTVTKCILNSDGTRLITGHLNNEINIWNLQSFDLLQTIKDTITNRIAVGIQSLCLTKDEKHLIVGRSGDSDFSKLYIYDLTTNQLIKRLGASIPPIKLEITPTKGDSIILGEYEAESSFFFEQSLGKFISYRILSLPDGKVPHTFPRYENIVFSSTLSHYLKLPEKGESAIIFRSEDNDELVQLENSNGPYHEAVFSPDGKWIGACVDKQIFVWETRSGRLQHQINNKQSPIVNIFFKPDNSALGVSCEDKSIRLWSLKDGELIWEKSASEFELILKGAVEAMKGIRTLQGLSNQSKNTGLLNTISNFSKKKEKETSGAKNMVEMTSDFIFKSFYAIDISEDGKYAALWKDDKATVIIIDLLNGKKRRTLINTDLIMQQMLMPNMLSMDQHSSDDSIDSNSTNSANSIDEMNTQYMNKILEEAMRIRPLKEQSIISPDWTRIVILPTRMNFGNEKTKNKRKLKKRKLKSNISIRFLDKNRKKEDYILEDSEKYIDGMAYSPNGDMIAASNDSDNSIRIWDAKSGKVLKTLQGHSGRVTFTANSKTLISNGWDRQVKIWDIEKDKELYSFIGIKGENEYIIMLPSGYYSTSRKETRALGFVKGKEVYPFDQYDLIFNRRDSLLEKFQSGILDSIALQKSQNLKKAFTAAYEKRMKRMGFENDPLQQNIHLPTVEVSELPLSSHQKNITVSVRVSDAKNYLSSIHIRINGVPLIEGGFLSLKGQKLNSFNKEFELELSEGENRIQIYAVNEAKATSLKQYKIVEYTGPKVKPDLYLIMMGASTFKDSTQNLNYPQKDLNDVMQLLSKKNEQFENIHIHKLIDQEFTLSNYNKLKNELTSIRVDDEIVVMLATHGMLSSDFNYYLATYETDFDNPASKSLSYEALTNFLTAIRARKKLLLLDACHSGEADEESLREVKIRNTENGKIKLRSSPSNGWERVDEFGAFDLMKELFVDLKNETGATTISSARAQDYAYEGVGWDNSIFTHCLIKGIRERVADLNSDGKIVLSELKKYLSNSVERLSNGRQRPVHRSENILNDWQIF